MSVLSVQPDNQPGPQSIAFECGGFGRFGGGVCGCFHGCSCVCHLGSLGVRGELRADRLDLAEEGH